MRWQLDSSLQQKYDRSSDIDKKIAAESLAEQEAERRARAAKRMEEDKAAAMEQLNSGGRGTYMDHNAEVSSVARCLIFNKTLDLSIQWYRKWQYRKNYSDDRDRRAVRNSTCANHASSKHIIII